MLTTQQPQTLSPLFPATLQVLSILLVAKARPPRRPRLHAQHPATLNPNPQPLVSCHPAGAEHPAGGQGHAAQAAAPACARSSRWRRQARALDSWAGRRRGRPWRCCGRCCSHAAVLRVRE